VTTPISDTVCHLYKLDLLYIQPTYQIWSLYDYLIWKYEKQRKMATLSTTSAVKNSPFSKIQNGGRPLHWKSKITVSLQAIRPTTKFNTMTQMTRIWSRQLPRYGDLSFFQDGGRTPSWICARIWTTHEEHLVVFIVVHNLVGIDAVVSIIYMF